MEINKTLIHFKSKQKFNEELTNGNILDTSIVFILDTKEIYTHGLLYDGSTFDPSDIEASILNIIDNYVTKTELPTKVSQLENDANYITASDANTKQDTLISGTNIKTINGESILGSGDIVIESSSAYKEMNHGTNDTTFTLTPNTFHVWDKVASLDLSFAEEQEGIANEYLFQFASGFTATTLTLPDGLKWMNDNAPIIESNKIYQVSILKGLGSLLSFTYKELISFTVNIESYSGLYKAEKGMTWDEFVNSDYNTSSFDTLGENVKYGSYLITNNNIDVLATDVIVDGGIYINKYVEPT